LPKSDNVLKNSPIHTFNIGRMYSRRPKKNTGRVNYHPYGKFIENAELHVTNCAIE